MTEAYTPSEVISEFLEMTNDQQTMALLNMTDLHQIVCYAEGFDALGSYLNRLPYAEAHALGRLAHNLAAELRTRLSGEDVPPIMEIITTEH